MGKALTDNTGLNMKEVVGTHTGKEIGATYFRGSQPIDGIWATPDITVTGACVMPCGYGVGDHRLFVVDFKTSSLVGSTPLNFGLTPLYITEIFSSEIFNVFVKSFFVFFKVVINVIW